MALFEEAALGSVATSAVVGIAAVVLTPIVMPVLATAGRPALKAAIKGGLMLYDRGREFVAEMSETVEDIAAEVRAERAQEAAGVKDATLTVAGEQVGTRRAVRATTGEQGAPARRRRTTKK